ncbi:MAG: HK97 gp10 family phage protein [Pedobacter sp.]
MQEELAQNAAGFSSQLQQLAVLIDAEISQAFRKGVLDVHRNITKRSPVDTGAYRASNAIANLEPSEGEGVVKGVKDQEIPESVALQKAMAWTWKVGDGDIWLFNNLPYAERLENGWSKQAPMGIYRLALQEMMLFLYKEIQKMKTLVPTGGGTE